MPEIKMDVIHWIFQQCHCPECGESVKVGLPAEACFDQRHTPLIAQLRGFKAMSRKDPVSFAKRSWVSDHPRHDPENCRPTCQVDQTSRQWHHHGGPPKRLQLNRRDLLVFKEKVPQSLWAMVIERVAYFGIGVHRSKEDFHHQLKDGGSILTNVSHRLFCCWMHGRQTCLPDLIRRVDGLAER